MSHVAEGQLVVMDLDALKAAAGRLGGEMMIGQQTHAWWGSWVGDWREEGSAFAAGRDPKTFGQCEHAIRIAGTVGVNGLYGQWEIGVVKAADGNGYKLVYDNYGSAGRKLEQAFGVGLTKLAEEYGAEVAIRQMARAGFRTQRVDVAQTLKAGR